MGMVAVLVGPLVVRSLDQDPFVQSIEALRDFDHQARIAARTVRVSLELRGDGLAFAQGGAQRATCRCMAGMQLTWSGADGQRIDIDARGRSVDLRLHLYGAGRTADYRICGLTGSWQRVAVP